MTIGAGAELGYRSVFACDFETTFGTPITTTTLGGTFEANSANMTLKIDEMKSSEINGGRAYTRRFQMGRNVAGTVEKYLHPTDGIKLFLNALGGTLSSTAGSVGVYSHVINVGETQDIQCNTSTNIYPSLTLDIRKGPTRAMRYKGCKVNQMTIKGEIGNPITVSYDMIGQNADTITAISDTAISYSAVRPFLFTDGTFKYDNTLASITATSLEQIVGFEMTVNNNITSDNNARAIGTNTVVTLPAGRRDVSLKVTMRVDTSTTFDRFLSGSTGAINLGFTGPSITNGANYSLSLDFPAVYYNNCDPEISGPDVITIQPDITSIKASPTATSYDIRATLVNGTATY